MSLETAHREPNCAVLSLLEGVPHPQAEARGLSQPLETRLV